MRVIGFLNSAPKGAQFAGHVAAFRAGLKETGCVEGKDVRIVFKWAQGKYTDLPKMAADLVKRRVDVIATTGGKLNLAIPQEWYKLAEVV
jgi:putative ABC transport system substrate-binding protein